jgi:glycosyltransferase involved in cell wall biosynthesis
MPGVDSALVKNFERQLLKQVDVVFASAKLLVQEKGQLHKDVRYLPHAVDYELFGKAAVRASLQLDQRSGRPIIGYLGMVGEHLDLCLVSHVARSFPDAQVLLVGPIQPGLSILPAEENILYLAAVSHEQVPQYMSKMDVGIVPYQQSERIRYVNPTKVREFLAAGCPVIITDQPEAHNIGGPVFVAQSHSEFVDLVRANLETKRRLSPEKISATMVNETWSSRAKVICSFLESNDSHECAARDIDLA